MNLLVRSVHLAVPEIGTTKTLLEVKLLGILSAGRIDQWSCGPQLPQSLGVDTLHPFSLLATLCHRAEFEALIAGQSSPIRRPVAVEVEVDAKNTSLLDRINVVEPIFNVFLLLGREAGDHDDAATGCNLLQHPSNDFSAVDIVFGGALGVFFGCQLDDGFIIDLKVKSELANCSIKMSFMCSVNLR